ncbi:hypothetical protein [Geoglobus acetivorans]
MRGDDIMKRSMNVASEKDVTSLTGYSPTQGPNNESASVSVYLTAGDYYSFQLKNSRKRLLQGYMVSSGDSGFDAWSHVNLPNLALEYQQFNNDLGGPAWHYRSSFWVIDSTHMYLNVKTKAGSTGTYRALMGGGPGYIPYAYPYTTYLYVN